MKAFKLAAAAIFATSTMAMAQDKVQISYSGVLSLEYLSEDGFDGNYFHGNGDVSFRWSTVTDVKFGVELGIERFNQLGNDTNSYDLSAYYASGFVEGRFGKISIGMPRSVMYQYFSVPPIAGSELLDLELGTSSDYVRIIKFYPSAEEGGLYGARYDGKIGPFEVAASSFKFSDVSDSIEEIVASYDAGQWAVSLGTTIYGHGGDTANNTSLAVKGHSGKISGGLVYIKWDVGYQSDFIRAFVSYDINDVVSLNTQILSYQGTGSASSIYSFDLAYKLKTGASINAGVITNEGFSDKIYNVSLGYKF